MDGLRRYFLTTSIVGLVVVAELLCRGTDPVLAGGGCRGRASTEGMGTTVTMRKICFVPTVLHVDAGQVVTWTNDESAPHSVAGATVEWGNYTEHGQGESVSYRFDKPGTYPYYCFVHNGMTGAIVVGDGRGSNAARAIQVVNIAVPTARPTNSSHASALASNVDREGPSWLTASVAGGLGLLIGVGASTWIWRRRSQ